MTKDTLSSEGSPSQSDLRHAFEKICKALETVQSREELTEFYKKAAYMVWMTHSTPLDKKDREMIRQRETTEQEFVRTVRLINRQAEKIGVQADYSESWENIATNGYETEGKDLEPQDTTDILSK